VIVDENIRLRKLRQDDYNFALSWYNDTEIQWHVNGTQKGYNYEQIRSMYEFQIAQGDFYIIEYFDTEWLPIGDVALMSGTSDDLPIMIGDRRYWRRGIASKVLNALIEKAKLENRDELSVTIYFYNTRSINLYTKLGFKQVDTRYVLKLK
jgi:RimJ/RimL family protein N-acetyltransferase